MSHWRDLLMLNKLRAPVGNLRIFIRIRIRILNVVQSADPPIRILPVAGSNAVECRQRSSLLCAELGICTNLLNVSHSTNDSDPFF